jgi:hypothetical protein
MSAFERRVKSQSSHRDNWAAYMSKPIPGRGACTLLSLAGARQEGGGSDARPFARIERYRSFFTTAAGPIS